MTRMEEYAFTKADKVLPETPVKTIHGTFDSTWKDLLLTWNGVSMTYDAIGNMVKKGNTTYTWTQGRKLSTVNNGKKSQYFYDHTGRRVRKTVDGVTTDFRMAGELLMSQKAGDVTTYFSYDSAGNLIGMSAGSNRYFYTRNAQNDITGLIDENGTSVVQYQYDSWGKLLGITGSLASTIGKRNPFRYRGYYYDDETGMYYLQSRYYDPEIKRFICADKYASTGLNLCACNMYVYCYNNPILFRDKSGTRPIAGTTLTGETDMERAISFDYMNNRKTTVDWTNKLMNFMNKNVIEFQGYIDTHGLLEAMKYFYNNVKDGGIWDIKLQEEWQFEPGKKYFFKGEELRQDDPGNINFGYIGAAYFPLDILCSMAGVNQITKYGFKYGNIWTYFDDFRDNEMIKKGFYLYKGWFQ